MNGIKYSTYLNSPAKRCFDLVICTLVLFPAILVISCIAIWVLVVDGWPVIFVQKRVGQNGREFNLFKIRTLENTVNPSMPSSCYDVEAFTTATGKFLRKSRLDELPQIFCILSGNMSLVGPRPELPNIVKCYSKTQVRRLAARPGLTGLWQTRCSRKHPIHKNIKYDLYYLKNASLWLDIKFLLETIPFLLWSKEEICNKTIGYITGKYPCASETFLQREIDELLRQGFDLRIFAASNENPQEVLCRTEAICYRPALLSIETFAAILYALAIHPIRLLKLLWLMIGLLFVCRSDAGIMLRNLHTICFFAKIVERHGIRHIHACFFNWPACIGLGISTLSQVPMSIAAHARDVFVEGGACQLKVKRSKFVICCNRAVLEHLKTHINQQYHKKCRLNYHGIKFQENIFAQRDSYAVAGQFIIAVGRLVEKKGFGFLLEAFSEIVKEQPSAILVIVGDGPYKQNLQSQIDYLRIAGNVHLTGWLENRRTIDLISHAGVLVVPSIVAEDGDRDGIPNVILEAFSVGTPVAASALAGICDIVADGHTGLLAASANSIQLAQAIRRLLRDKALASYVAQNAKVVLKDKFDLEANCKTLGEYFQEESEN